MVRDAEEFQDDDQKALERVEARAALETYVHEAKGKLKDKDLRGRMEEDDVDHVQAELRAADEVFRLVEGAVGYRLVTHPRYARWVRVLRNEPAPARLSQSALETLAIIAYRQPVTRGEIETIRGVSADAGLNKLLERELVYVPGRADLPGRPLQYGTTDKFLEFVGVKSLVELPSSDVLSPRQIDEWLKNAMNPTTPGDVEMGLPLEEGEGDTPMEDQAHLDIAPEVERKMELSERLPE